MQPCWPEVQCLSVALSEVGRRPSGPSAMPPRQRRGGRDRQRGAEAAAPPGAQPAGPAEAAAAPPGAEVARAPRRGRRRGFLVSQTTRLTIKASLAKRKAATSSAATQQAAKLVCPSRQEEAVRCAFGGQGQTKDDIVFIGGQAISHKRLGHADGRHSALVDRAVCAHVEAQARGDCEVSPWVVALADVLDAFVDSGCRFDRFRM